LELDELGVEDNFFELEHSVAAMLVIARIREVFAHRVAHPV